MIQLLLTREISAKPQADAVYRPSHGFSDGDSTRRSRRI